MDRRQNMVANIAFYENDFFILSLFRIGEFAPASCKAYLAPRNQRPAPKQRSAPTINTPHPAINTPHPAINVPHPANNAPHPPPCILEKLESTSLRTW